VVAFDEKHLNYCSAVALQFSSVIFDHHAMFCGQRTGVHIAPIHLARTDTTVTGRLKLRVMAETRNVYACSIAGLNDGLARGCLYSDTINGEYELFLTHVEASSTTGSRPWTRTASVSASLSVTPGTKSSVRSLAS
jgi:hypothetical protein